MRESSARVTFLTAACAAALVACGGVHGIPIDKTATDIARAVCPAAWRCCTADQLKGNDAAGTSEQDCEAKTAANFRTQLQGVQYSEDQKRAHYEQAKVDACLETIRSAMCADLNMTNHLVGVPGCDSFVTPLVPVGGTCSNDYECIDGFCKASADPAMGVCVADATAGMSCADAQCGSGLTCDPVGTQAAVDDVCVMPGDDGAACTDPVQCKSGNCSTSGGSGMTCAPSTAAKCFYSTGCSASGEGLPGPATVVLMAAFVILALARTRRRGRE